MTHKEMIEEKNDAMPKWHNVDSIYKVRKVYIRANTRYDDFSLLVEIAKPYVEGECFFVEKYDTLEELLEAFHELYGEAKSAWGELRKVCSPELCLQLH